MFGSLALWVPVFFLGVLIAKFWMEPRGYRLRSSPLKMLLGAIALAAVVFTYGSAEGIEPGVSIIVTLMGLKILEAHTAREFQVMTNVGWILCLCGLFLSQDLLIAACICIAFTLLLAALIEFHRGPAGTGSWTPLGVSGKLLLQAAPIVVGLFILFPRVNLGFRIQLPRAQSATSGFSGELSAGSVSTLARSSEIAFRAEFPDNNIPPPPLYWRGVVLTEGEGFEWRPGKAPVDSPASRRAPATTPVRQWITVEPHNNHWMFALDWPADSPPGAIVAPGNYLWSGSVIKSPRKYQVNSFGELANRELYPKERERLLQVPGWISPKIRQLVGSWRTDGASPADIVSRATDFFRTQGFRYSVRPGEYQSGDLEEFLFRRKLGFCEHYAGGFATLMRLAGIPSRVVLGYLGGEYNEWGGFFIVRQSESHAWCEVWLPDKGWIRADPTSVVAPDRLSLTLNAFLESRSTAASAAPSPAMVRNLGRFRIFHGIRLAWQSANYAWDTHVLSFDETTQLSVFSWLGSLGQHPFTLLAGLLVAAGLVLAGWFMWNRLWSRSRSDPVRNAYRRFCQKLGRRGIERAANEGPRDFSARAAGLLPERSEQIWEIAERYIRLRYSGSNDPTDIKRLTEQVNAF